MGITSLFVGIDHMIYSFVGSLLNLILRIASVDIFTEETLGAVANRVYGLLGIIILFKIILSCIQYLINPEKLSDKDNGIGQIIQRTVISFALLALIPTIFTFARSAQNVISATIPGIFLGRPVNIDDEATQNDITQIGNYIAMTTLRTFISVNGEEDPAASAAIVESEFQTPVDFVAKISSGCPSNWVSLLSFFPSVVSPIIGAGSQITDAVVGTCKYNYQWFFSIPVGVFLIYILLSMGIDVGIRSIKLSILELFAPISVASYIDSTERFKKWYQLAFKVYLDLFIRLIVIYFIVFMIGVLSKGGITFGGYVYKEPFINLYIIIALLIFAKSAPKFICDVLGLDGAGEGIADMFKRGISGGAWLGGMATSAFANYKNKKAVGDKWKQMSKGEKLKNVLASAGSAVAGATSAGFHGGRAFVEGKSAKEVVAAGHRRAVQARQNRDLDKLNGVGFSDRLRVRKEDFLGLDTEASLAKANLEGIDATRGHVASLQGNYNKAINKFALDIDVTKSNDFMRSFRELMNQSRASIMNGSSVELKNILNKLDNGSSISYSEILSMRNAAAQPGSGGSLIATELTEGMGTMKAMQKALWLDSMKGQVYKMDGTINQYLDPNSAEFDSDVKESLAHIRQDFTDYVLNLNSNNRFNLPPGQENNPEALFALFEQNFKKFDNELSKAQVEIRQKTNTGNDAVARASIQRRDSNKKS